MKNIIERKESKFLLKRKKPKDIWVSRDNSII